MSPIAGVAQIRALIDAAELASWQRQASCAHSDADAFFPEKGKRSEPAKRVCVNCPVRARCLSHALRHNERFGIWGGYAWTERRDLIAKARRKVKVGKRRATGHGVNCQCDRCDALRAAEVEIAVKIGIPA